MAEHGLIWQNEHFIGTFGPKEGMWSVIQQPKMNSAPLSPSLSSTPKPIRRQRHSLFAAFAAVEVRSAEDGGSTDDATNDAPSHVRDATRSASDVGCIMRILRILFALDGRGRPPSLPPFGVYDAHYVRRRHATTCTTNATPLCPSTSCRDPFSPSLFAFPPLSELQLASSAGNLKVIYRRLLLPSRPR